MRNVCFFVPLENFSLIRRFTITGELLQILTYIWHLWPISSEGSLTPSLTRGIRLKWSPPWSQGADENPNHPHLLMSLLGVELFLPVLTNCGCRGAGFKHQSLRMRGKHSNHLRHRKKGLKVMLIC